MHKDIIGLKKSPIKQETFSEGIPPPYPLIADLTAELPSSEQWVQLSPFFLSY